MKRFVPTWIHPGDRGRLLLLVVLPLLLSGIVGCKAPAPPIGTDVATTSSVYRQTHNSPVGYGQMSRETSEILHRYQQDAVYEREPEVAIQFLSKKAASTRDRDLLFALTELTYLEGERVRHSLKPWEARDARDYYLASAVYAWLFLLGDAAQPPPGAFDQRFRSACDLYNFGLGWALTERRSTNAVAILSSGTRTLSGVAVDVQLDASGFPDPVSKFDHFLVADRFVVRGLSIRNRQSGMGAPLMAVMPVDPINDLARVVPATALLRVEDGLAELGQGHLRARLEVYSPSKNREVQVGDRKVPLETDTTISLAYSLNQSLAWRLGRMQFMSGEERVPTGVYLPEPYRPGRVPVVFVHGTFSSPIKWAEMANALAADPELSQRCQFWYFIYNSGNPTLYSSFRLRKALTEKLQQCDPEGHDAALQQMVVIGHSQGGLLTKLTATDTGDKLLKTILKTNDLSNLQLPPGKEEMLRKYTCFEALPFVKRVIFISTPHRGSYGSTGIAQTLARKIVELPGNVIKSTTEFTGLTAGLDLPKELRGTPTSVDSMSPKNPLLLELADIPLAPGIKGHSIVAVKGEGDYHEGKDGLVRYSSAHVDYVESELIVRSPHSCQGTPAAIEEVRRILHEHLATLPGSLQEKP